MSSLLDPPRTRIRSEWGWMAGLAAAAFAVRLLSVLRGGGLFGRIGYDGSVYYASASALTRGLLPYRDFLLLHPPGIVLALLPFAALGRVIGDADAFALARLAWFGLGGVSTILVFAILRSRGLWPAVTAALFYALFVPAVTSEHTTSLEAVGSVCLLAAVALLTLRGGVRTVSTATLFAAGSLLGISTGTKIWGAVLVLALVGWSARRTGLRRALVVLAGALASTVIVCLPFFLAAPGPMWQMVVLDQIGRRRDTGSLAGRLIDIAGLSQLRGLTSASGLTVVAAAFFVVLVVLALREPLGRLAALIFVVTALLLLLTPPWSIAYTGLAAPSLALLFGCAATRLTGAGAHLRPIASIAVLAGLIGYGAVSLPGLTFGSHFPGRSLEQVFTRSPGCVTTDDPIALIETGALQRNFALGCPVMMDPGGYSYHLRPAAGRHLSRSRNPQWQRFVRDHLGSGEIAVVVRFRTTPGLSRPTKAVVSGWPVVAEVGGYQVRRPTPRTVAPTR